MGMGDRIAVVDHGKLRQVGTPSEIYDHPPTIFVASFLGTPPMNWSSIEVDSWLSPEHFLPREMLDGAALSELPSASIAWSISIGAHLVRRVGWLPGEARITAKLPATFRCLASASVNGTNCGSGS